MLSLVEHVEPTANAARSQSKAAYGSIRAGILSGRHAPGTKLKIQDLSVDLEVSPGAIREALSRLVPEQLVVSREQRGFVVAPLSLDDLEQLTDLRCEIEAIACRRALARGGLAWESHLIASAELLQSLPICEELETRAQSSEWLAAHAAFHRALLAAAGNERLLALHQQLYEQSERYRGLSVAISAERDVAGEHREILKLALQRDSEGLVRSMTCHIRDTARLIMHGAKHKLI